MTDKIRGIVLPLPTVFLEDGRVDEKLMRELTDWFVACGVHAFFILGSYGQGPAMTPDERKVLTALAKAQARLTQLEDDLRRSGSPAGWAR